jgi:hypothetical protein
MSLVRWSGLVALLGGIWCTVLTPIQAYIWAGADSPPLVLAARPLLNLSGKIFETLGPWFGLEEYYFYGRMFFLVYVSAIAGLMGLHALQRGHERREEIWFRMVFIALALALAGDILAYWGGSGPIEASPLQGLGFMVEMLAVLAVLIGAMVYGRTTLRGDVVPGWVAWFLIASGLAAIPMVYLTGYIPHGAMLPFSLGMAAAGYCLLVGIRQRIGPDQLSA